MSRSYTITLLRHGLPQGAKALRGITDFALTTAGFKQMQTAIKSIEHSFDYIISSPLTRCNKFAKHYSLQYEIPLEISSLWQEMDFGKWDGQLFEDLFAPKNKDFTKFKMDPWHQIPPNGESLVNFNKRINKAWLDLFTKNKKNILVVTHSGVICQLIYQLLDLKKNSTAHVFNLKLPYAAIVNIDVYIDENNKIWPQINLGN